MAATRSRPALRVEHSLEETEAGLRLKAPKTKRGRRNIALPQEAIAMLRGHKIRQMEIQLALGQGGAPSIVFSDIEGKHLKRHQSQLAADVQGEGTAESIVSRAPPHARIDADPRRGRYPNDQPPPWA